MSFHMSSESTDHGSDGNAAAIAARGKRPVWNMPSNDSMEVGPVMGAVSWPALSESTKASPKSSSDSLKSLSDVSASAPPGPLISSPSAKPTTSNPNPNSTPIPTAPTLQKSIKRGSGSGSSSSTPANGGVVLPSPSLISTEMAQMTLDKQVFPEPSPKGLSNKNNHHGSKGGGFTPQPHSGADHQRGYSGNRRGNNGGGYGNRRDQDRGSHEWTHHRSVHMQQQQQQQQQQQRGGIRPYPRPPPPVSTQFISPPPQVQPYVGNPMGFPDLPSPMYYITPHPPPESLRGMPFVTHPAPHAMFFPALDPQRAQLLKQIDYYFSNENLCKDIFLRQNMDGQGWVPISLIAGFNRVKLLANNIPYILDTVRLSNVVEVQGERIRRRNDWINWVLLPSNHFGTASGSQSSATPDHDSLAARLQTVGLEGATTNHSIMRGPIHMDVVLTRSASGNLNNQFQVVGDPSGDENGQFTSFTDSDRFKSVRNLARSDTL